jgi:two-component system sensor histidine kinase DesK
MSDDSATGALGDGAAEGQRHPPLSFEYGSAMFWLLFLALPVADTLGGHYSVVWKSAAVAIGAAFALLYIVVCVYHALPWRSPRYAWSAVGAMAAAASVLTVRSDSNWAMLFIFTASLAAALMPPRVNRMAVFGCVALLVGSLAVAGDAFGDIIGYGTTTLGIGILLTLFHELQDKNEQLDAARTELARLAVGAERERFARDLHDLLGQTLSVIALKAELAGRLADADPAGAQREINEVRDVARTALGEVRDAVGGYRRPTLDQELDGARAALAAAGVRAEVIRDSVALAPEIDSALAWTVREGATNVIRHAGATVCEIRIAATLEGAQVEIRDDGPGDCGSLDAGRSPGSGLTGLAERVKGLGGAVDAGPLREGGFRLAMTVPLR